MSAAQPSSKTIWRVRLALGLPGVFSLPRAGSGLVLRLAVYGLILLAGCAEIRTARAQNLDLLSTRAENPLSNLPSLTFNHIFSAHLGRFQRPQNITNVQP